MYGRATCITIIAVSVSNRCGPIGPRIFAYSTHSFHCDVEIDARNASADGKPREKA